MLQRVFGKLISENDGRLMNHEKHEKHENRANAMSLPEDYVTSLMKVLEGIAA